MKLAITGASGYIGQRLVVAATAGGFEVLALGRRPPEGDCIGWRRFDLADEAPVDLPADVGSLVHLAATTSTTDVDVGSEVLAAERLIAACRRIGARFVFVSSQTACEDAPTAYGKSKWLIERKVLAAGGLVIRPGQVYGGPERALFGTLVGAVRKLPVIPGFLPAPCIQPVHVDDLATAILAAVGNANLLSRVFGVGAVQPVSFTCFLRTLARARLRRTRPVVPVPTVLIRLAIRMLGKGRATRLGLKRLLSLFDLPEMDTAEDMRTFGITLRPLSVGMARSGNGTRRSLLEEGRVLLGYVLRDEPAASLVRRYARSIQRLRAGNPLGLPRIALYAPVWLAVLEGGSPQRAPDGGEYAWRLNAAVAIAEASPQGARRFLQVGMPAGFIRNGIRLAWAVSCEAGWRVLRSCLGPVLRLRLRGTRRWK
ncbi:MAG: sugar nucleotide-binding protein [Xanthomonadaceae bacterium]|nr:sugar nucleotide-binding protein [Xanthomonadaceae bacterium]